MNSVIKIYVILSENGYKIKYIVDYKNGKRETYNDKNIPGSIIEIMNKKQPCYHSKSKTEELYMYGFIGGIEIK